MCDTAKQNAERVTFQEPNAFFWNFPGCQGTKTMSLPPGDYVSLYEWRNDPTKIGLNDIDGLWVPPNMTVQLFNEWNYQGANATFEPGLHADLNNPNRGIGRNMADSIKIHRTRPWRDFLVDCCRGRNDIAGVNPTSCGKFWGNTTDGSCNAVMDQYCTEYPNDIACSCYSVPILDTDPEDIKRAKVRPDCWSQKCATAGYIPTNLRGRPCPDIKICKQNIDLLGSNNMTTSSQFIQDCSDRSTNITSSAPVTSNLPTSNQPGYTPKYPPPPEEPFFKKNLIYILLIVIAIIVLGGLYYMFSSPAIKGGGEFDDIIYD